MEVIAVSEDKFWLHEGEAVPPGAEEYDGPPPIPLDELRRDLPAGWTAERAWHYGADELGHIRVMPITIVKSPDGDHLQFFPQTPRRGGNDLAGSAERTRIRGTAGGEQ